MRLPVRLISSTYSTEKKIILYSFIFVSLLLICLRPLAAAKIEQGKSIKNYETIAPEDITKGMKGYGLTVFGGTKIERFDVEVLGVLENKGPCRSLILVKAKGNILEHSGVIAGMSGSPVYIEGKLAGALAYAWSFAKDAIAGVQPISGMEELANRKVQVNSKIHKENPIKQSQLLYKINQIDISDSQLNGRSVMSTIQTPVFINGYGKRESETLKQMFKRRGMHPIVTGTSTISSGAFVSNNVKRNISTATSRTAPKKHNNSNTIVEAPVNTSSDKNLWPSIKGGQAIGATLVSGDMNISAVGTVTYRNGNKIVAFGHPFFGLGDIEIPMTRANVQTVLPSLALSFKMANTNETIGTLIRDGATGIVGILGKKAPVVKVQVNLQTDEDNKKIQSFNFKVLKHPMLTAPMIGTTIGSVLSEKTSSISEAMIKVETKIKLKNYKTLKTVNHYTTELFPASALQSGLEPLYSLLSSRFEEIELEEVVVSLKIKQKIMSASIEGIRWQEKTFQPGDELRAVILVKPWKKPLQLVPFSLNLPKDLPDGKLKINIASARSHLIIDKKRDPDKYKPENVTELMSFYEKLPDFRNIIVSFTYGGKGTSLRGRQLKQLPLSIMSIADNANGLTFGKLKDSIEEQIMTKWVTRGKESFSIKIVLKN